MLGVVWLTVRLNVSAAVGWVRAAVGEDVLVPDLDAELHRPRGEAVAELDALGTLEAGHARVVPAAARARRRGRLREHERRRRRGAGADREAAIDARDVALLIGNGDPEVRIRDVRHRG